MAAVNKIAITGANVLRVAENSFDLSLEWTVDESSYDYSGDFELTVYNGSQDITSKKIESGGKKIRSAKAENISFNDAQFHSVILKASGGKGSCDKFPITLRSFGGVGVRCCGYAAIIVWDAPHSSVSSGIINLKFQDSDNMHTFIVNENVLKSCCFKLPLSELWLTRQSCTVSMVSCAGDNSFGPKSEETKLILSPLKITAVNMEAVNGDNTRKISAYLERSDAPFIQLGFYEGERLLFLTESIAYSETVSYTLKEQYAHNTANYELAVFISDENANSHNRRKTDDNTIPLAPPKLSTDISDRKLTLLWENSPAAFNCTGYELKLGEKTPIDVYGSSFAFNETADEFMDTEIKLTPKYSSKRGIPAKTAAFREGIYCNNGILAYRKRSYNVRGFEFILPVSAFAQELTDTVKTETFKIEKNSEGYKVTVSCDEPRYAEYKEWIESLFKKQLNPSGYYRIRDVISRLSAVTESERLLYIAGIDPNHPKRADILPGMTIRAETAFYMPQTSPTAANLAGYTSGNVSDYTVGLSEENLDVSLSLGKVMGHFAYTGQPHSDPLLYTAGSGLDFFNIEMKKPFWVLKYFDKISRSENLSDMYDSLNSAVFALDSWNQEPDSGNQVYMVFRARSTITLMQTVFVNKTPRLVPVGMTASELMSALGRSGQLFRLYRSTGLGGMTEVFWFGDTCMYLIQGDCIEV